MLVEQALHQEGGYKYWEIPRLHNSEKRRFLEGVAQRGELEEQEADRARHEAQGDSPGVAERRREIEQGQQQARQDLLDEVNRDAAAAGA